MAKRKFRYKVVVKGVTISKHFTLVTARKASKGKYAHKVVKIGTSARKKTYRKRRY